jgi:hypothetical protein
MHVIKENEKIIIEGQRTRVTAELVNPQLVEGNCPYITIIHLKSGVIY